MEFDNRLMTSYRFDTLSATEKILYARILDGADNRGTYTFTPAKKKDLANWMGVSGERISAFLRKAEKLKLISFIECIPINGDMRRMSRVYRVKTVLEYIEGV